MSLAQKFLEGSPEEKEAAKEEISALPDTVPALSAEEEAEAKKKLAENENEFEQNGAGIDLALNEIDKKTNEAVEEEAEQAENEQSDSGFALDLGNCSGSPHRCTGYEVHREQLCRAHPHHPCSQHHSGDSACGCCGQDHFIVNVLHGAVRAVLFLNLPYGRDSDFGKCLKHVMGFPYYGASSSPKGLGASPRNSSATKKAYRKIRGKTNATQKVAGFETDEIPTPTS